MDLNRAKQILIQPAAYNKIAYAEAVLVTLNEHQRLKRRNTSLERQLTLQKKLVERYRNGEDDGSTRT